jgi:hypothetical protein
MAQLQIYIMMSIFNLMYLLHSKPFETLRQGRLELFNEAMVLIAGYHMIVFTDLQPYIEDAILVKKQASETELAQLKYSLKAYKYPFKTDKSAIEAQLLNTDDSLKAS